MVTQQRRLAVDAADGSPEVTDIWACTSNLEGW